MSGRMKCLQSLDSSWLVLFAGLPVLAAVMAGVVIGLASWEARRVRKKEPAESDRDCFEEDDDNIAYLSDIYETMPNEYRVKEQRKIEREDERRMRKESYCSTMSPQRGYLNDELCKVMIIPPLDGTTNPLFKLPNKEVSVRRSRSQSHADYLLRMLSKPEDYQDSKLD